MGWTPWTPDPQGLAPLPPPPGSVPQMPISPRAPDIQAGAQEQVGPGPSSGPVNSNVSLPPPPEHKRTFWSTLGELAPTLAGGALGIIGGPNSALGNFGAGGAQAASQQLIANALQRHKEEHDAGANRLKNVAATIDKMRKLNDPRYSAVVQEFDQSAQNDTLDAKTALKLREKIDALPDPDRALTLQAERDKADSAIRQATAIAEAEEKLKDAGKVAYPYNGQSVMLQPEQAIAAQRQAEAAKAQEAWRASEVERNKTLDNQTGARLGLEGRRTAVEEARLKLEQSKLTDAEKAAATKAALPPKLTMAEQDARDKMDAAQPLYEELLTKWVPGFNPNIDWADPNQYKTELAKANHAQDTLTNRANNALQQLKGVAGFGRDSAFDNTIAQQEHLNLIAASPYMKGRPNQKYYEDIKKFNVHPGATDKANAQAAMNILHTFAVLRKSQGPQGQPGLPPPPGAPAAPSAPSGRFQILKVE